MHKAWCALTCPTLLVGLPKPAPCLKRLAVLLVRVRVRVRVGVRVRVRARVGVRVGVRVSLSGEW